MHLRSLNACWVAAWLAAAGYSATIGSSSLADAAKAQDKDGVRALLKLHADVNAAEPDGTTALHWAAHWNDLDLVNDLLRAGANVKTANRYGATPLSEAAQTGSGALIERLLKAGADPNTATTNQGETVLMTASRVNNVDAVKVLLEHGASAHARDEFRGQTALMWAAAEGHPEVVKLLVAHGADLDVRSFDRDTNLPKMEAGTPIAPIARGGLTALLFAARQGETECARLLLDAGADINQVDSDGNNALILATLNTHYDFAQMLLDRGTDPNLAAKNGRAALYTAVEMHDVDWSPRPAHKENDKTTSMDLIHALIAHGANVNAQLKAPAPIAKLAQDGGDRSLAAGATPFMRAARSADVALMRLLLDHNAEPTLANKDGLNALMLAAGSGWNDAIKGNEAQALEAVKLCLSLGLSATDATDKGETALHGAAHRGADTIVKLLAEKGANVNAANKRGFTPLDIAQGKGAPPGAVGTVHETTVALLKQLGGTNGKEIKTPVKPEEP
ncbi:MAG TPA: ankyrin repeat domain-containing protein [Bryobacteraceae bacterium]|nr:ankyrin repeat domain-containing protein [Bryobacteraceae bacterium]